MPKQWLSVKLLEQALITLGKVQRPLLAAVMAALIGLLAGCGSTGPRTSGQVDLTQPLTQPPSFYLDQAEKSEGQARYQWRLLASQRYLQLGQLRQAELLCKQLDGKFNTAKDQSRWALHCGETAWRSQDTQRALKRLDMAAEAQLSRDQRRQLYELRANIFITQEAYLDAARELDKAATAASASERVELNDKLWDQLQRVPDFVLAPYLETSQTDQFSLWLQLAAISRLNARSPLDLMTAVNQWQKANPDHPAAERLPANISTAMETQPYTPNQVAVLVPLSGRYSQAGQAIQDGLVRAYLSDNDEAKPELKFYDSANGAMAAYRQAIAAGADFIVGPLTKEAVNEVVAQRDPEIPLLALNQLDTPVPPLPDRYFFALSPETEAVEAANRMWQAKLRHPLLLGPANSWGARMIDSYTTQWQEQGGELADTGRYANRQDLPKVISQVMGTSASKDRSRQLQQLLGVELQSEPRNRQDIDGIYVLADALDARLLKPYIDLNISAFSERPQVFASSRSYRPGDNNADLEGVYISEIPLFLQNKPEYQAIRDELAQLWPERNASNERLYAMGHDAYNILAQLRLMQLFPGYGVSGLTGRLSVTPEGVVQRRLAWGQITNGTLKPVEGYGE